MTKYEAIRIKDGDVYARESPGVYFCKVVVNTGMEPIVVPLGVAGYTLFTLPSPDYDIEITGTKDSDGTRWWTFTYKPKWKVVT